MIQTQLQRLSLSCAIAALLTKTDRTNHYAPYQQNSHESLRTLSTKL